MSKETTDRPRKARFATRKRVARSIRPCDRCGKPFEGAYTQEVCTGCTTLDDLRDNDRWLEPEGE